MPPYQMMQQQQPPHRQTLWDEPLDMKQIYEFKNQYIPASINQDNVVGSLCHAKSMLKNIQNNPAQKSDRES